MDHFAHEPRPPAFCMLLSRLDVTHGKVTLQSSHFEHSTPKKISVEARACHSLNVQIYNILTLMEAKP